MSAALRAYQALAQAERGIVGGLGVRYAVETAAGRFMVSPGDVALLALQKFIACERARAEQQALDDADAEIGSKRADAD